MNNSQHHLFALKGHICYSIDKNNIHIAPDSYVVCENGICLGVFETLPESMQHIPCLDYTNKIIIPGLIDLHVHASQYAFRGFGMDLELIDWLNTYTFVEEAKFEMPDYANKAYDIFTEDLIKSATTRACIFATAHSDATLQLMNKLEKSGLICYVGKVNMDRNCPDYLCEKSAEASANGTEKWLQDCNSFQNTKPILTPRFIPTCSNELMEKLSLLQEKYHIPVQSHLSENIGEIEWVKSLCPDTRFYGDAYHKYNMFGNNCPTIMAHCVHSSDDEIEMMQKQGVFVAHCPESNANLSSGIAPIKTYLEKGVKVGLGSDIAAGSTLSIFRAMALAIQCSKLRWRLTGQQPSNSASTNSLTVEEAFFLGTKGGGEFFGTVGSFEAGYEFDAVVIDDSTIKHPQNLSLKNRLERLIYLSDDRHIICKFVAGNEIKRK